ncbi:MAG TPA: prevent-host-death protein [Oceanospirillaceae bacterium]|nr:prevent-host-death protein [Oceanospirillaceae bacterium]
MMHTKVSSREFNQNVSSVKKSADIAPVFITDRGLTAHVLMSAAHYHDLTSKQEDIVDLLAMAADIDFEPTKTTVLFKPADLS